MGEVIALFIPGVVAVAVVLAVTVVPLIMEAILEFFRGALE